MNRRGLTLIEMIVVISIFAMLLGFTVVFLKNANRDLGVGASAHHLAALLRDAHQRARGTSSPVWVVLDTKGNSIHLLYKETVEEWHFEDAATTGAFGKTGRVGGGTVTPGRVGMGMGFRGSGTVDCGEVPTLDPGQGVAAEFWFLRRRGSARQTLFSLGKEAEAWLEGDGKVCGRVGDARVSSGGARVPTDTWCDVEMVYARGELKLFLNRSQVDAKPGKVDWGKGQALTVGDKKSGLDDIIDEFRLGLILPREPYTLPGEAKFELAAPAAPAANGEFVLSFDGEGRLDPARHSQPVKITIKSPVAQRSVTVGTGGDVLR